jgi:magnesium chelatase family protein
MLVGAMNPCRCGRASEPGFTCSRKPNARCAADYQTRISGPLIDRSRVCRRNQTRGIAKKWL